MPRGRSVVADPSLAKRSGCWATHSKDRGSPPTGPSYLPERNFQSLRDSSLPPPDRARDWAVTRHRSGPELGHRAVTMALSQKAGQSATRSVWSGCTRSEHGEAPCRDRKPSENAPRRDPTGRKVGLGRPQSRKTLLRFGGSGDLCGVTVLLSTLSSKHGLVLLTSQGRLRPCINSCFPFR